MENLALVVSGVRVALHVTIDPVAIRPVTFYRDEGETPLGDEPLADR
jgi:hypothetical protein